MITLITTSRVSRIVNMRFITPKCMAPHTPFIQNYTVHTICLARSIQNCTSHQWYDLHSLCDRNSQNLNTEYDRIKHCSLPPGGFLPPMNTPTAPMQLPNEVFLIVSLQSALLVSVKPTSLVPQQLAQFLCQVRSQKYKHHSIPHFRRHQLRMTTLPIPLRPWRKTHFQTAHLIAPCLPFVKFLKPSTPQLVPSTLLFPPRPILPTDFRHSKPSCFLPRPVSP